MLYCSLVCLIIVRNESSIRAIKSREKDIRQAVALSLPKTSKVTSQVRDKTLVKTEKAINLWLEDMNRKRVPIDGRTIREKALSLYKKFKPVNEDGETSTSKEFKASIGWLHSFKSRFALKNIQVTGESASADVEAAKNYPAQFKAIIESKSYLPEQVFNADETGLFWKKMPTRTYIAKTEKQAPGFKVAKDRVTITVCSNAAGHLIKTGFIYRSQTSRVLKNKDKKLLPVYWQSNKKAWVTAALFTEWFHECFIPETETKRYLEKKGHDNAPGHPEAIKAANENVEVVFLPPNTTSILQPLDQGVIRCFKATYTKLTFSKIRSAMDADENLSVGN